MNISPSGQACGARITGLDLSKPLPTNTLQESAMPGLSITVLAFPDQRLDDEDLVRVTQAFGDVGDDPFFVPMNKKTPVVALTRRADEQAPVFAENWHTDWSFKKYPPIGTCLYSLVVPPVVVTLDSPTNRWRWHRCQMSCEADSKAKLPCTLLQRPMALKVPTGKKTKATIAA